MVCTGVIVTIEERRGAPRRLAIRDGEYTIGSAPDCEIAIFADPAIVARHARLLVRANVVYVVPIGETRLDGVVVHQLAEVRAGSTIRVGGAAIRLAREDARVPPGLVRAQPPRPRPPTLPPLWRDVLSADPTEHELLAAVRASPDDAATRAVYGDWLEQHRDADLAGFVREASTRWSRDAVVRATDATWRAIVARGELASPCPQPACPRAWHRFTASSDEWRRDCTTCLRKIRYCVEREDERDATSRGEGVVLDVRLDPRAQ
jgi:uncharacterized protein (TIGR02996 family)